MEAARLIANDFDSAMEKKAQGRDPRGWARMGGLPDPSARKRVIRAEEVGEVREGTQRGRSKPPSQFVTIVPGRGGLKVVGVPQVEVPVKPGCVVASEDLAFDKSRRAVVNFRTEIAETITAHGERDRKIGRDKHLTIVNA